MSLTTSCQSFPVTPASIAGPSCGAKRNILVELVLFLAVSALTAAGESIPLNISNISRSATPVVSVLITYYNAGAFIREAVESARNQTYPHIEVVVVDDGSDDPCARHLSDLTDVQLIRQANGGVVSARNTAARHSSGAFLLFLDGDDRLLPTAVQTQMDMLLAEPSAGFSFGAVQRINESGALIRGVHVCRPRRDYFGMLLESNPLECMGGAMIRRSAFESIGGFDQATENISYVDDYDLYLRLAHRGPVVRNSRCVVEYRQHANNASRDKEMMLSRIFTVLDKLERTTPLTPSQRRRLQHGRRRWTHALRGADTLGWKIAKIYYGFRAMLSVRWL
jgi:glycosyltransferase involved in cell wall biosynthesis